MSSKTASKDKRKRITVVPVTTMEEIPVLSEKEHADLLNALEEAEACVQAGEAIHYDSENFKARLVKIYRERDARP